MSTIDDAERMLSDFEAVLIQLSGKDRADLGVELARLMDVAGAADPYGASAEQPRRTGANVGGPGGFPGPVTVVWLGCEA
jgi:hypothetical protein